MNVQSEKYLIALAFIAVLGLILYCGFRLHKPVFGFVAAAAVTAGLWVAVERAISTDYRDADGFGDCWPTCNVVQNGVGTFDVLAPAALILLAIAFVAFLGFRWRGRHREANA
jgi:hypothetical protein